jgi:Cys-rich repeat protein
MRRSLLVLALGVVAACTPELCARNSDCPSGQVCTAAALCVVPADASVDSAPGGVGSAAVTDAATTIDAPVVRQGGAPAAEAP